jgi:hypothetical protein
MREAEMRQLRRRLRPALAVVAALGCVWVAAGAPLYRILF